MPEPLSRGGGGGGPHPPKVAAVAPWALCYPSCVHAVPSAHGDQRPSLESQHQGTQAGKGHNVTVRADARSPGRNSSL